MSQNSASSTIIVDKSYVEHTARSLWNVYYNEWFDPSFNFCVSWACRRRVFVVTFGKSYTYSFW